MMDFNKPHMVPQTTKSLAAGAEGQRQKQIGAYKKDKSNNKRQMDDLRHHQYSRNAKDVNKQKSQMQRNAAKSSRMVTGTTAYNKEEFSLRDFMDLCEGRQSRKRRERKIVRDRKRQEDKKSSAIVHVPREPGTPSPEQQEIIDKRRRDRGNRRGGEGVGRRERAGAPGGAIVPYQKKGEPAKKPSKAQKKSGGKSYGTYTDAPAMTRDQERAATFDERQQERRERAQQMRDKDRRFAEREKREKRQRMWNRAKGVAKFGSNLLKDRGSKGAEFDAPGAEFQQNRATLVK